MCRLSKLIRSLTLVVVAFGIVLPVAPVAIGAVMPPVRNFVITEASRLEDGRLRLIGHLDKRWCVFEGLGFAYLGPGRAVWRVGYVPGDQPADSDTNRPPGFQTLGPWIVAAAPSPAADRLTITVRHRCGLIDVVTTLARIDVTAL